MISLTGYVTTAQRGQVSSLFAFERGADDETPILIENKSLNGSRRPFWRDRMEHALRVFIDAAKRARSSSCEQGVASRRGADDLRATAP